MEYKLPRQWYDWISDEQDTDEITFVDQLNLYLNCKK